MRVIKFKPEAIIQFEKKVIDDTHIDHPLSDDTLCGAFYGGYPFDFIEGKVTCPECIRIVRYCKKIDSRNLIK